MRSARAARTARAFVILIHLFDVIGETTEMARYLSHVEDVNTSRIKFTLVV